MNHVNTSDFGQPAHRDLSLFTQIKVLFGGVFCLIGSLFFWFGLPFSIVFIAQSELVYLFKSDGTWEETVGIYQEEEYTNSSINDEPVMVYYFSYNIDGKSYQGASSGVSMPQNYSIGEEIPIEYKTGDFNRARIVGMRENAFPVWIAIVLIFPLIGGLMYFFALKKNYKALKLLQSGKVAYGKLLRSTATNVLVNDEPVYKYEFGFEVDGRTFVAIAKTHITTVLEDEEKEMILYDSLNPDNNLVYDSIHSVKKLDHKGNVPSEGAGAVLYALPTLIGILITLITFAMQG